MDIIGVINDRYILYQNYDLANDWSKYLPDGNWLFVGLVENDNYLILNKIARKIIDKDVCFACCIGLFGEKLHDFIDENLAIWETEIKKYHLPKHQVLTTWHKDIKDGLWFALFTAFHETESIEKIFCLDIGIHSNKKEIAELIEKFKQGYIPIDE